MTKSTSNQRNGIIFLVEQAPEGGYTAHALEQSIFIEAESIAQLFEEGREAVECHFGNRRQPASLTIFSGDPTTNRGIVEHLLRTKDKISAIRTYRKQTNAELADALRAIDSIGQAIAAGLPMTEQPNGTQATIRSGAKD